jgi:hypothetical protein
MKLLQLSLAFTAILILIWLAPVLISAICFIFLQALLHPIITISICIVALWISLNTKTKY